jgi:hypothetical protein
MGADRQYNRQRYGSKIDPFGSLRPHYPSVSFTIRKNSDRMVVFELEVLSECRPEAQPKDLVLANS